MGGEASPKRVRAQPSLMGSLAVDELGLVAEYLDARALAALACEPAFRERV